MKNKKGQIFTLIAVALIALIFLTFEVYSVLEQRDPIKTRISTMENFLFSIEKNLERQMYICGFRTIFLAEDEILRTGNYINVDEFFEEAFFNGSVNGQQKDIMLGATYSDLLVSINEKAKKINAEISMSNTKIYLSQEDPWNVKFTVITDFSMKDKAGLARWDKVQNISALIPIIGFEDPIFVIETRALISRKINSTIYEGIYVIGTDVSNLENHMEKSYYAVNPSAPNFLQRLEGDLSPSPDGQGIESFVDLTELSIQGLPIESKTVVDYIYFSEQSPTSYNVQGMPSWFKIDTEDNHLEKYNVTGLIY